MAQMEEEEEEEVSSEQVSVVTVLLEEQQHIKEQEAAEHEARAAISIEVLSFECTWSGQAGSRAARMLRQRCDRFVWHISTGPFLVGEVDNLDVKYVRFFSVRIVQ